MTMMGELDFESYADPDKVVNPMFSVGLIVSYIILVSVMLLNMLIAMMGTTYERVTDQAQEIWQLEMARILLSFETEMSPEERKETLKVYRIDINGKQFVQVYE